MNQRDLNYLREVSSDKILDDYKQDMLSSYRSMLEAGVLTVEPSLTRAQAEQEFVQDSLRLLLAIVENMRNVQGIASRADLIQKVKTGEIDLYLSENTAREVVKRCIVLCDDSPDYSGPQNI